MTSNVFLGNHFLGSPFRRFKTLQNRSVLSFGVMFNFTLAAKGVRVQFVNELVKEEWFLTEVRKGADVIILVGHVPVSPLLLAFLQVVMMAKIGFLA